MRQCFDRAMACDALLHAVMGRRAVVLRLMCARRLIVQREPEFWLLLAVDQPIHLLLIGAIVLWLTKKNQS